VVQDVHVEDGQHLFVVINFVIVINPIKVVLQMVRCLKKDIMFLVQRKHQKNLQLCLLSLAHRDHLLLMMLVLFKNFYKLNNQAKHLEMVMNSKNQ
jgi:hypothetical protein